jgi:hypothetical protein
MMGALCSSEKSVLTRATRRKILEDSILHFASIFRVKDSESLGSQRVCTSRRAAKRTFRNGIFIVVCICYHGDTADWPLLRRMWWLASRRGQQCKICCFHWGTNEGRCPALSVLSSSRTKDLAVSCSCFVPLSVALLLSIWMIIHKVLFNSSLLCTRDRLCGLVVRLHGCKLRGPGFDS